MPAKKNNSSKQTSKKRKSTKKETELKLEAEPVPAPAPAPAPVDTPVNDAPVTDTPAAVSIVQQYESRIDTISETIGILLKTLKDLNSDVKVLKKELSRDLKKKEKTKKKTSNANRPPSGFAKPTKLSPELCKFMGIEEGTLKARTEVTKFFCDYFKQHNLQDPAYKRNIIPNAPLKKILKLKEGDQVSYFNLQKFLKIHYP